MGLNEEYKLEVNSTDGRMENQPGRLGLNYFTSTEPSEDILPNEVPAIVPCYNGRTLKIHEELVVNGLSAISIRHSKGNCFDEKRNEEIMTRKKEDLKEEEDCLKKLTDLCHPNTPSLNMPECLKGKMKRRNSFWNIHRPELSKLTWPENFVSSSVLQDFFHNHLQIHGTFCEPLHEYSNRGSIMDEEFRDFSKLRELVPPRILPPDEKIVNIMEKSRSVQLNDEDLDPETMVHKSRAEFCVTIGEYIRRPFLKRTTSQQMPKSDRANRIECLSLQHETVMPKETMMSEERVSSVIANTDACLNSVNQKPSKKSNVGNISCLVLRRRSYVDLQNNVVPSPLSLNHIPDQYNNQVTEDSGDPARLRTILSPRDEVAQESGSRLYRM